MEFRRKADLSLLGRRDSNVVQLNRSRTLTVDQNSVPVTAHENTFFIKDTISEDRSGTLECVLSQRLAALDLRHRHRSPRHGVKLIQRQPEGGEPVAEKPANDSWAGKDSPPLLTERVAEEDSTKVAVPSSDVVGLVRSKSPKNSRFEIPKERNLDNIDNLIAQATDAQERAELKQQKRLLRNRQAA